MIDVTFMLYAACYLASIQFLIVVVYPDFIPDTNTGKLLMSLPLVFIAIAAYIGSLPRRHYTTKDYAGLFNKDVPREVRHEAIKSTRPDPNMVFQTGYPLLIQAIRYDDYELVKYLVQEGADINATCSLGFSVLSHAVETGNHNMVKYLLKVGCTPTPQTMKCAYKGPEGLDPRMVKILTEHN